MNPQDSQDPRPQNFAVMWDCHGLEACVHLPDPQDITFALLKGDKLPDIPNIMYWALRARFNSQRHYEIYLITTEPGIGQEDIVNMFNADPQSAANIIRQFGKCYYY